MNSAFKELTPGRIDRLRSTAADLADLIHDPQGEMLNQRPAPGAWSAAEVLCHLLDIEEAYLERIQFILNNEEPKLLQIDPGRWVTERQYWRYDVIQTIEAFRVRRRDTLKVLESLAVDQWERGGMHPSRGRLTIRKIVHSLAKHDTEHLEQIQRALAGHP